jgi:error-prone DNA polymerase
VNATECWDIPALEEIRTTRGIAAVRTALTTGTDLPPGLPALPAGLPAGDQARAAQPGDAAPATRPLIFANGFTLSPYAETGTPGGTLKTPPRTLWHASPGSTSTPT